MDFHVNENTIYAVVCESCGGTVGVGDDREQTIEDAKQLGFRAVQTEEDGVINYCASCYDEQGDDLAKQEEIVTALWDFAYGLQNNPHDAKNGAGVSVHLASVGKALERIMSTFGREVQPIE